MYSTIENITIETSTFCNAECIICPNSIDKYRRKLHLMSLEDFENTLNLFPNLKAISLCGCYEPLSDSRLSQIFDIINKTHPTVGITLFSNGSLLNKWIDFLLNSKNLYSIIFSVHGYESYSKVMKKLDKDIVYNNIIKIIHRRIELEKITPLISVTSLRLSSNIYEIKEFKNFWKQQGVDYIHSFELMNWNNKIETSAYDNLIDKPKLTTRPCPMYEFPMVIDALCNVVRCCYNVSFSYGNVFKDGIDNYLKKKRLTNTYPDWDCIKCDGWKI